MSRITIQVLNVDFPELDEEDTARLQEAYVRHVASALDVDRLSVVDLFGSKGSVSLGPRRQTGMTVSAFVAITEGSSASAFAAKLYSTAFHSQIIQSTSEICMGICPALLGNVGISAVSLQLVRFAPLCTTAVPHPNGVPNEWHVPTMIVDSGTQRMGMAAAMISVAWSAALVGISAQRPPIG